MKKMLASIMITAAAIAGCGKTETPKAPAAAKEKTVAAPSGEYEAKGKNGTRITLELDPKEHRYYGRVVNRYNGSYKIDGTKIAFGHAAATLMMGLPGPMEDESAYFKFLSKAAKFSADTSGLTLVAVDGEKIRFSRPETGIASMFAGKCLSAEFVKAYEDDMECIDANKDGCATREEFDAFMSIFKTVTPESGMSMCQQAKKLKK